MKNKAIDNAKLGLFVLAGALFIIFSLYMIGRNRSLFGATFTVKASFNNVNGLTPGNNVRFAGIDVGTVHEITIESDTAIVVTMIIDKKARRFIKKNSIAAVATDGLMGNKLININTVPEPAPPVEENDRLASLKPVETDEMLRTLNTTNENIEAITRDLKKITQKINNSNSLWSLLSDTVITHDLKAAAAHIKQAGRSATQAGDEITQLIRQVGGGKGLTGTLITDTLLVADLRQSLIDIHTASNSAAGTVKELETILTQVKTGNGLAGALVSDTTIVNKLNRSIQNIEQGTFRFNENMEALKHNFLFRGYFRKQDKKSKD
ncbi:MAG: MCE family protein [Bacteroidia bacterium]|nr:MCE family protein [Bacteroidia bacterium]